MDGNGRWARARGLPRIRGHQAGVEALRDIVTACAEWDIPYVTLYSFSTENWARPRAEVDFLMGLLQRYLRHELDVLQKNNVRLLTIGSSEQMPEPVRRDLAAAMQSTAGNTGLTLTLALSYGSRAEIVEAVRALAREAAAGVVCPDDIDENMVAARLQTSGTPDPDLLIRTSGEMRISNFLLWQIAYTELWVTPTYWPDFRRAELLRALEDYAGRERRFGKVEAP
ncbi:MAG: isoprenyl transferase [Candidatus Eisenbacteria bacterium]|jgi:undecaprenyl diphosphate synthase|nr:isoprenyl transferase [Candidatus Eisenbacteria bacterium]